MDPSTMMGGIGMMVWGLLSFLLGLTILVVFILAVVAGVKWIWEGTLPVFIGKKENALDILKKRYASGEISKEEFEQAKITIE